MRPETLHGRQGGSVSPRGWGGGGRWSGGRREALRLEVALQRRDFRAQGPNCLGNEALHRGKLRRHVLGMRILQRSRLALVREANFRQVLGVGLELRREPLLEFAQLDGRRTLAFQDVGREVA